MKRLFTLLTTLVLSTTFAQSELDLNVTGFTPEVEKSILSGDRVSYFEFDKGGSSRNIIVKIKGPKGTKRFFGSVDVKADANGHYDFSGKVTVKESSRLSFDDELEILVSMPTIYGNVIWSSVKRSRDNFTDPIILDKYNETASENLEPRKRLSVSFSSIAYNDEIKKQVTDNGDSWKDRKKEHFHFYLKNKGDTNWKIDQVGKYGKLTNGKEMNAKLAYNDELDLDKTIVMRVEVTTEKGNLLWNEMEFESREMTKIFFGENYKIVESSTTADQGSTNVDNGTNKGEPTDDGTTSADQGSTNNDGGSSDKETSVESTDEGSSNEGSSTTNTEGNVIPSKGDLTTTKIKPGYGPATDTTTPTIEAICGNMNAGDTLVSINGSKICVRKINSAGSKALAGTLAMDCNLKVGTTVFPLQGEKVIQFSKADASLNEAVLRENVTYSSSVGDIVLKKGAKVTFRNNKLIGASLADNASLNVSGSSITCKPNAALDQDIRFDVSGKLVECTIAEEVVWSEDLGVKFPVDSRLIYKGGILTKVFCKSASTLTINGKQFNVKADDNTHAYELKSKTVLAEINSGDGNSIDVEGQSIKVKAGTKIGFTNKDGKYAVSKFFVAEQVTVNVYKKDKSKEVVVKAGKKIVMKDGVVTKAG